MLRLSDLQDLQPKYTCKMHAQHRAEIDGAQSSSPLNLRERSPQIRAPHGTSAYNVERAHGRSFVISESVARNTKSSSIGDPGLELWSSGSVYRSHSRSVTSFTNQYSDASEYRPYRLDRHRKPSMDEVLARVSSRLEDLEVSTDCFKVMPYSVVSPCAY